MESANTHKIAFEKRYTLIVCAEKNLDLCYYVVKCDNKQIEGLTIDKKPNGKYGVYDAQENCYFGVKNGTLKECKEFVTKLYCGK